MKYTDYLNEFPELDKVLELNQQIIIENKLRWESLFNGIRTEKRKHKIKKIFK
jgi:hypothetical protein